MIRFVFLIALILLILIVLNNRSKKSSSNTNLYKRLIIVTLVLGVIFLIFTSGRIILPQIMQIIKMGLPLITKLIGI